MKIADISNETLIQFLNETHGEAQVERIVRNLSAVYITRSLTVKENFKENGNSGFKAQGKQENKYAFVLQSPEVDEIVVYWENASGEIRTLTSQFEFFMDELAQNSQEEPEIAG